MFYGGGVEVDAATEQHIQVFKGDALHVSQDDGIQGSEARLSRARVPDAFEIEGQVRCVHHASDASRSCVELARGRSAAPSLASRFRKKPHHARAEVIWNHLLVSWCASGAARRELRVGSCASGVRPQIDGAVIDAACPRGPLVPGNSDWVLARSVSDARVRAFADPSLTRGWSVSRVSCIRCRQASNGEGCSGARSTGYPSTGAASARVATQRPQRPGASETGPQEDEA